MKRFYITGRSSPDWSSHVQQGSFYTSGGFSEKGLACGAGGIFEAYDSPVVGSVEVNLGYGCCCFWASGEKMDLKQLEWRWYTGGGGSKYLVTSNRRFMATGWTYGGSFYARGIPSNGCNQKASITL
eukprot:CAMPEP_0113953252 /NCGR_PEP_ID=MMETSP1339-20121228/90878_1 /TAXON_ID=94617 /ORGANISM="Fibrocapsa japonica" /LENGTH=126 /DNA_ID=CAMNT_0000961973 /DNA_START=1245 /DNA_END=1625 /DNA_ORIENTATION=- /assembly_acc=CAM_ASM_000762